MMHRMSAPAGVEREVFIQELFHVTDQLMRLLDCHAEGIASTGPFMVLKNDHPASEGDEIIDPEVGIPAEAAATLGVTEHEVNVRMIFREGKLKKASLLSDGKPIWGYTSFKGDNP